MSDANRQSFMDAAESETLRMRGNSMHGNRETLGTSAPQGAERFEKALPYGGHERFQGVARPHSTKEADEQSRLEGGGGARGGKGTDREKRRSNLTRTGHRAGEAWHRIEGRASMARWRSRWGHGRQYSR